ncbi:MAG: toxic anion resistance protein, partial [Acidimicrobiia bacterium]
MSATPESLTPPATAELTLTPPSPVAAIAPAKAEGMVRIDVAAVPALDAKVSEYVESIVTLDVRSPAFAAKAGDVRSMGD